jgi:2-phospho-L-lactate/phosphoenolpyruvate guanylyltransferase
LLNCIVIPIKNLAFAKTRLSPILTPTERADFAAAMLQDVIFSAKNAPSIGRVVVVTPEGLGAIIARENGATLLLESQTDGLNRAVQIAITHAQTCGYERLLIVLADLPLIQPQDLSLFFQRNSKIIISPSRDLDGTNALLLSPPNIIQPRYGRKSFAAHKDLARAVEIEPEIIQNARLSLDIDTPEDLMRLCEQQPGGLTGAFLKKHEIGERLKAKDAEPPKSPEIQPPFIQQP